jgi:hypothetical protein
VPPKEWRPIKMSAKATDEKPDYMVTAERIVAAMPKSIQPRISVEPGGGKYALVKLDEKRTLMSVRSKNVRVTLIHDGSAQAARDLGAVAAGAADRAIHAAVVNPKPTADEKAAGKKADAKKLAEQVAASDAAAAEGKKGSGK